MATHDMLTVRALIAAAALLAVAGCADARDVRSGAAGAAGAGDAGGAPDACLAGAADCAGADAGDPVLDLPSSPEGYPDPLVFNDGRRVTRKREWVDERRAEVLELFRAHVYGRAPGRPAQVSFEVVEEDPDAMDGAATLRRVAIASRQEDRAHRFELILFAPNAGRRSGAFLLLNHRPAGNTDPTRAKKSDFWPAEEVIARGYAIAAVQTEELAPDDPATFTDGVIRLMEGEAAARPRTAWKMIGAWSWGAGLAMDYLATDPMVDPARVAVIGHSRGGKAALWAAAQDERFGMAVSNESGCAGAALSRRPYGETVASVNLAFPHWFADAFTRYGNDEAALPVDQHMLIALLAPRAVSVSSAAEDDWSDPEGEFLGLAHASPVYLIWGFPLIDPGGWPAVDAPLHAPPRGYHVRAGEHDMTLYDWRRHMDVADRAWGAGGP